MADEQDVRDLVKEITNLRSESRSAALEQVDLLKQAFNAIESALARIEFTDPVRSGPIVHARWVNGAIEQGFIVEGLGGAYAMQLTANHETGGCLLSSTKVEGDNDSDQLRQAIFGGIPSRLISTELGPVLEVRAPSTGAESPAGTPIDLLSRFLQAVAMRVKRT